MCNRARKLDVCHALTAYLGLRDLDTALLADDAAMLQALVLTTQAFVVLDGTEDLGAEQAVTLGFERAVVDRLGFLYLTERPRAHHVRRRQTDANRVEVINRVLILEKSQQIFH